MIQGYAEYKDSGVDWLGEIPEVWEVEKAKWIWHEIEERSQNGTEALLSVSQYKGVVPRKIDSRSEDLSGYKSVYKNHLVTNIMLAWMGGLGISDFDGIVSPAYSVYRLKTEAIPRFIGYLYRTSAYLSEFARRSTGVVPSRWRMYTEDFGQVFTVLPPLPEQTAIAEFLDDKTTKIETLVGIKRRQIELLVERKQILIQNAVTKGLNPNAPMKDSGVDWLGDIPAHWEVVKIKHISTKIGSGITPSGGATTYLDEGIPLLRSQNILFGKIDLTGVARISPRIYRSMENSQVKKGDVLLNITGGSIGRCHYVEVDSPLNVNQHVCIVRPNGLVRSEFLNAMIASEVGQSQIWFFQQGGGREGLNFQALKNFIVPLPPVQEQGYLMKFIAFSSQKIDDAITIKQYQITKLNEYKATLIDSAVTGKIKVV